MEGEWADYRGPPGLELLLTVRWEVPKNYEL